jgi:hypothetical protein
MAWSIAAFAEFFRCVLGHMGSVPGDVPVSL